MEMRSNIMIRSNITMKSGKISVLKMLGVVKMHWFDGGGRRGHSRLELRSMVRNFS